MRRAALLILSLALVAAACRPAPPPPPKPTPVDAKFQSFCTFSHALADDPIVFPGAPGAAHLHHFFGNVTTNAASTYTSLRGAPGTTCQPSADLAAYWVPALLINGTPIPPQVATFYYRGKSQTYPSVTAFPPNFRMIAGDQHAHHPQTGITHWGCTNGAFTPSDTVPTCPAGSQLKVVVNFANCWDGVNLDSADHKSHVAYSSWQGLCPASHPVVLPAIQAFIRYPTVGGPNAALSSGSTLTMHADFFNAWEQSVLESRVQSCINVGISCKPDGTPG